MAKKWKFVDNLFIIIEACSKAHQLRFKIKDRTQDVIIGQKYWPHCGEHYAALKSNSIKIVVENNYAVDYIDRFYIGQILNQGEKPQFCNIKFLHQLSDNGKTIFKWSWYYLNTATKKSVKLSIFLGLGGIHHTFCKVKSHRGHCNDQKYSFESEKIRTQFLLIIK